MAFLLKKLQQLPCNEFYKFGYKANCRFGYKAGGTSGYKARGKSGYQARGKSGASAWKPQEKVFNIYAPLPETSSFPVCLGLGLGYLGVCLGVVSLSDRKRGAEVTRDLYEAVERMFSQTSETAKDVSETAKDVKTVADDSRVTES